ncbi:MAG: S8 family serine peptidase [Myxococcaceae bacterium]|nr:S8 family serine peptidase [Myxococcaceae bacterium]
MQTRQTRGSRFQHKARTQLLALSGMLALALGSGCDEQRPLSNPRQGSADHAKVGSLTAPLIRAPAEVRIPGEYVVVFAEGRTGAAIESAARQVAQAGGDNRLMHQYSVIPGFAARLDDAALEGLRLNPGVAYIQENQRVQRATKVPTMADGIDRVDQRTGRDGMYDDHGRTGAGVHVYVIDSGINSTHTEFTGRIGGGYGAILDGWGTEDCDGHGSHVSSTAVGSTYGMARQATLHPVRVLDCAGEGTWGGVIAGLDFVYNDCPNQPGPCVANLSLSGGLYTPLNQAIATVVDSGITVVVSAGNDNVDACTRSPASEPKALTVAAVDYADFVAAFSNWGTCVDIFAPGVDILGASIHGSTTLQTLSGTSMASAHVAGVVAQFLSSNPGATPAQVELYLKGAASLDCVMNDPKGSPNMMLFNDLSQGNYYCSYLPASCEGLCGGPGPDCFCDAMCEIYNDCCDDYAQVCK